MGRKPKNEVAETKVVRGVGDNSPEEPIDGTKLLGFITEIEKVNKKKAQVLQDLREVYADAKDVGYDNRTIRTIVKERSMEEEKRTEQKELYDLYTSAIGMLDD